jgi:hypothetical protein
MNKKYQTFSEFYPFYLSQHQHSICRRLHFIGSLAIVVLLTFILITGQIQFLVIVPILGYGFAWLGHFVFEKNKPATFTYPIYSLLGDWVMFKDMITGKIKW